MDGTTASIPQILLNCCFRTRCDSSIDKPTLPLFGSINFAPFDLFSILQYNVQEYVPEALESLSEFESSPSPDSSYDNESLKDNDFGKLPPGIPPQLQLTPLSEQSSATDSYQLQRRPRHAVLNHLYIQNNRGEPVALGSTNRFLQKYVTVVLYKPTRRWSHTVFFKHLDARVGFYLMYHS